MGVFRDQLVKKCITALDRVLVDPLREFVCPLCLELVRNPEEITLEHVPPESQGGRKLCVTCKRCNNSAGHSIEGHSHREQLSKAFISGDGISRRIHLTVGGQRINAHLKSSGKKISIDMLPNRNNPINHKKAVDFLYEKAGTEIEVDVADSIKYNRIFADSAHLKTAYLAAFSTLGYRYIFQESLNSIRKQIAEPNSQSVEDYRVYLDGANLSQGLYRVVKPLEAILVHWEVASVVLPPIIGSVSIGEFSPRPTNETSVTLSYNRKWNWPTKLEMELDDL